MRLRCSVEYDVKISQFSLTNRVNMMNSANDSSDIGKFLFVIKNIRSTYIKVIKNGSVNVET